MIFANSIAVSKQLASVRAECCDKNLLAPAISRAVKILILLGMALPLDSSAGALEKYYVPQQQQQQQQSGSATQSVTPSSGYVNQDVYIKFKAEIQGYDRAQKSKLESYFRTKLTKARREKNNAAVSHYERLIGILSSGK
jgi:hypothetical protein